MGALGTTHPVWEFYAAWVRSTGEHTSWLAFLAGWEACLNELPFPQQGALPLRDLLSKAGATIDTSCLCMQDELVWKEGMLGRDSAAWARVKREGSGTCLFQADHDGEHYFVPF